MGMPAQKPVSYLSLPVCWGMALVLSACAQESVPVMDFSTIEMQVESGQFGAAEQAIDAQLNNPDLSATARNALAFERERMRRIRLDFSLDRTEALARARRFAPAMSEADFDAFDAQGLIEAMTIDGQRRYFNRAPANLFRLSEQARTLRENPEAPFPAGSLESLHAHHAAVVATPEGVQQRVRIRQTLTVEADAVPAGETLKVWIPYPREIPGQQDAIQFLHSEPATYYLAPNPVLQRTVYLEKPALAGTPTEFSIEYELTTSSRHTDLDPDAVLPVPADPALAPYLAEEPPHIVFTDALRLYSAQIVGDETNPYRIAQKLFAAVDTIPWAGAREYSTLRNISDYALHAGHADCGQQTLLLISLLRLNGIPARWQSGWVYADPDTDWDTMHDWGWLYLAPYGWVPMDVTHGLLGSDDPRLYWFYLGSLDAYRVAFNDAISTPFDPPKQHVRSETVDSQRGEVEWRGGNLYFDQWDYGFQATLLPFEPASSSSGEDP